MEPIILETHQLTKQYNHFTALSNASLTIQQGDIVGLIGRNGAGKTTLMKLITTLTQKTSGSFTLFGEVDTALSASKRRIGCLIENPAFFEPMTAYQNLKYYAIQKGMLDFSHIDEVLDIVQLTNARNKKFKTFSLGMKQRLGVALALLDNPDFVILDEPINGLDPIGISELREALLRMNRERNITLLISSHILSELYLVATKFCFIEQGHIIKECTKEELDEECSKTLIVKVSDAAKASVALEQELLTTNYTVVSPQEIRLYDFIDQPALVNRALTTHGVDVYGLQETGISLEDYFKQLVQGGHNHD